MYGPNLAQKPPYLVGTVLKSKYEETLYEAYVDVGRHLIV